MKNYKVSEDITISEMEFLNDTSKIHLKVIALDGSSLYFPAVGVLSHLNYLYEVPVFAANGIFYTDRHDLLNNSDEQNTLLETVKAQIQEFKENSTAPIILIGHSLSAWWIIDNYASLPTGITGVILISPYISQKTKLKLQDLSQHAMVYISTGSEDLKKHRTAILESKEEIQVSNKFMVDTINGLNHNELIPPSLAHGLKFVTANYRTYFNQIQTYNELYTAFKKIGLDSLSQFYVTRADLYDMNDHRIDLIELNNLANCLMEKKDNQGLSDVVDYMLNHYPDKAESYLFSAYKFEQEENITAAVQEYKRAMGILESMEITNMDYFNKELNRLKQLLHEE